jgi:hypothetical protein
VSAATDDQLAVYLGLLGVGFSVDEPPELVDRVRDLADRYTAAVSRAAVGPGPVVGRGPVADLSGRP